MSLPKITFQILLLVLAFSLSVLNAADDESIAKPNVVLFLVDDMGWMDSSAYGSRYYETPNMQRLAKQSMRFTDAYAVPLCSPTRASILSGQYSSRHGVTSASGHRPAAPQGAARYPAKAPPSKRFLYAQSKNYLEPDLTTLAEVLRAAGYRTGHFGKWHLGLSQEHWPEKHGFDVAFHAQPSPGPSTYFSPYGVHKDGKPSGRHHVGTITDGPDGEYITDRLTDEAIKFVEANKHQPFFQLTLLSIYFETDVYVGLQGGSEEMRQRFVETAKTATHEGRIKKREEMWTRYRIKDTNLVWIPEGSDIPFGPAFEPSAEVEGAQWRPADRLMVFVHDNAGEVHGVLSLDDPADNRRPDPDDLGSLETVDRLMTLLGGLGRFRIRIDVAFYSC